MVKNARMKSTRQFSPLKDPLFVWKPTYIEYCEHYSQLHLLRYTHIKLNWNKDIVFDFNWKSFLMERVHTPSAFLAFISLLHSFSSFSPFLCFVANTWKGSNLAIRILEFFLQSAWQLLLLYQFVCVQLHPILLLWFQSVLRTSASSDVRDILKSS